MRTLRYVVEVIHVFYARVFISICRSCDNLGPVVPLMAQSIAECACKQFIIFYNQDQIMAGLGHLGFRLAVEKIRTHYFFIVHTVDV